MRAPQPMPPQLPRQAMRALPRPPQALLGRHGTPRALRRNALQHGRGIRGTGTDTRRPGAGWQSHMRGRVPRPCVLTHSPQSGKAPVPPVHPPYTPRTIGGFYLIDLYRDSLTYPLEVRISHTLTPSAPTVNSGAPLIAWRGRGAGSGGSKTKRLGGIGPIVVTDQWVSRPHMYGGYTGDVRGVRGVLALFGPQTAPVPSRYSSI